MWAAPAARPRFSDYVANYKFFVLSKNTLEWIIIMKYKLEKKNKRTKIMRKEKMHYCSIDDATFAPLN